MQHLDGVIEPFLVEEGLRGNDARGVGIEVLTDFDTRLDSALKVRARRLVATAFVAAVVSALPQMRPWEYFNEFVGGAANAYKFFSDEGVNLGQRSKELVIGIAETLNFTSEFTSNMLDARTTDVRKHSPAWALNASRLDVGQS